MARKKKALDDDSRRLLKDQESREILIRVSTAFPDIDWEVKPIYGYGVSLVGRKGESFAQYKLISKGGIDRKSIEDILVWAAQANTILQDEVLGIDLLSEYAPH